MVDHTHIAARSKSQLNDEYPMDVKRSLQSQPGSPNKKSFKRYCQGLEYRARADNSYQTLEVGQNNERLLFRQQFKNFKCYLPGEGSQKHGEMRKMDSKEIMEIIKNHTDDALDIDLTDEQGGYLPRRMKLSYRDSALGGRLRLDLENRAFRVKLAHTTDYR